MNIFDFLKTPAEAAPTDRGDGEQTAPAPRTPPDLSDDEIHKKVVDLLYQIIDPELGISVVDLGLVYEINITSQDIYVRMTMTTPGCPMHESIAAAAERAIKSAFSEREVNVHVVWEPPWTPERLSENAKRKLGFK